MARSVTQIKLAIVASGRTQREIAEAAGTDEYRLSRIVNGRELPPVELRLAIAAALGVDVSELWPGQGAAVDQTLTDSKRSDLRSGAA